MTDKQPDLRSRWFITDYVLAVIADHDKAEEAVEALRQAGFNSEAIRHLTREEAAEELEPESIHSSSVKHFARVLWQNLSIQGSAFREIEEQVQEGNHVIAVHVKDRDEAKCASEIMHDHNAHHIQHFGPFGEVIQTAP